uniref:Peptidase S74 domain-containing protein n=1 Tax=Meloidogyne hapla TaxID=6305 RepID=A0A1I8BDD2_MELHA
MLLSKTNNLPNIKCEYGTVNQQQVSEHQQRQGILHHQQQQQSFEDLEDSNFGGTQRTIKFEPFLRESWATLFDINQQPLPIMPIVVVADKGFNFSPSDNCFVNQKKNHFQITVNIGVNPMANANSPQMGNGQQTVQHQFAPHYVRTELHGRVVLLPIAEKKFYLSFCGVKSDMQTYEIPIKQSQTDRKPIDHLPVCFTIDGTQDSVKQTVPRLHFSETTMNNHRKNGKPNPEQKFFLLVMKLSVETAIGDETRKVLVQSFHSDRVIVRASNPGQFEQPESDQSWKNQNGALTFSGPVCIGSDKPIGDAQLTVHGNIAASGQITRPSDKRLKEDIEEISTAEAMGRVAQMRLVEFAYKPEIAARWGLSERDRHRVGVIAQELAEVLPEAVKDNGEFLTVDDTRIFYDTVAAAQELYRLTGNLECKIGQVEKISHKLAQYARKRRQLGSMASGLSDFSSLFPGQNFSSTSKNFQNNFENYDRSLSQSRTSLTSAATAPAIAYRDDNEDELKEKTSKNRSRNSKIIRIFLKIFPPNFLGSRNTGKRDKKPVLPPPSPPRKHRCRSHSSASAYCGRQQVYCHGQEAALCNSKFTQGTIVTLVVIMALCLVTMCTLYVVDLYNRTYLSPHFHHYHPYGGEVTEKQQKHQIPTDSQSIPSDIDRPPPPGKMRGLLDSDWIPPLQSNILPISLQYCSTNFDKNNPFNLGSITKSNCQNNCCPPNKNLEKSVNKLIDKQIQTLLQIGINNIFELSAGSFLQSAYKFRIGHSTGLCQMEEKQKGRSFDEFNLIFYRECIVTTILSNNQNNEKLE